jgi:tripartite-type tricarboxylate transporter receptor subunit TctC
LDHEEARPRALGNCGSAGVGTVFHLTGELFKQLSGLPLQHVPYRGGAPTVTALRRVLKQNREALE